MLRVGEIKVGDTINFLVRSKDRTSQYGASWGRRGIVERVTPRGVLVVRSNDRELRVTPSRDGVYYHTSVVPQAVVAWEAAHQAWYDDRPQGSHFAVSIRNTFGRVQDDTACIEALDRNRFELPAALKLRDELDAMIEHLRKRPIKPQEP